MTERTNTREQWGSEWFDRAVTDLRLAVRTLGRSKLFAAFSIITLALAIASNTVVYSVVDALVFPHVPFDHPEQLMTAHLVTQHTRFPQVRNVYEFLDRGGRTFEPIAVFAGGDQGYRSPISVAGTLYNVPSILVSENYFEILRVRPKYGRLFTGPGSRNEAVAVISEGFWHRISGDTRPFAPFVLTRGTTPYTVIGVLPHQGAFPADGDVFIPQNYSGTTLLRIRSGMTRQMALAELNVIAADVDEEHVGFFFQLSPAIEAQARQTDLPAALLAATIALLLIACANVANLLVARGVARHREIAIRLALGASRRALVRWLFAESAMVAVAGGALGILLALWGAHLLTSTLPSNVALLGLIEPQLSWRVVAVAVVLTVGSAFAFGLVPAIVLSNADASALLKSGGGATPAGTRRTRFRALVSAEIAGAMTLLVAASLMGAAAAYVHSFDFGYDARNLVTGYVGWRQVWNDLQPGLPDTTPISLATLDAAYATLVRLRSDPAVVSASELWGSDGSVLSGSGVGGITTQDPGGGQTRQLVPMRIRWVSPEILRTLHVRVLRGRDFDVAEPSAVTSVIIDESAAKRLWPGADAVGQMLRFGIARKAFPWGPWMRVIGVMPNIHLSAENCAGAPCHTIFVALGPGVLPQGAFVQYVVRVSGHPEAYATRLRQTLTNEAPGQLSYTRDWAEESGLARAEQLQDFIAGLFITFAIIGVLLALIGVNGVATHAAEQRVREFGIRLALGAEERDIVQLVLHDGVLTALLGLAVGLVATVATTKFIERFLYGISDQAPIFMAIGLVILFAATIGAGLTPALRASRTNPVETLRSE